MAKTPRHRHLTRLFELVVCAAQSKENFDPRIIGPWMDLWDLEEDVRGLPNAHIDQYLETDPAGRDPETYKAKKQW